MLHQQTPHLFHQRRRQVRAGCQVVGNFAEYPRPPLRGAAHHHGVSFGVCQNSGGFFRGVDVAVGHHRNPQRCFHGAHRVVFGFALVALFPRATVYRDHGHAGLFGCQCDGERIFSVRGPAGAHFERHRHAVRHTGLHHRVDDLNSQSLILHQRRTGPAVADFFRRAAHVDVDDLRAPADVVLRGLRHHLGVGAGNLHRDRPGFAVMVGTPRGLQRIPQIFARGHHLADRVGRPQPFAQLAERPVRHTRHGRDKNAVR